MIKSGFWGRDHREAAAFRFDFTSKCGIAGSRCTEFYPRRANAVGKRRYGYLPVGGNTDLTDGVPPFPYVFPAGRYQSLKYLSVIGVWTCNDPANAAYSANGSTQASRGVDLLHPTTHINHCPTRPSWAVTSDLQAPSIVRQFAGFSN